MAEDPSEPADAQDAHDAQEDMKRKFREALDRKRARQADTNLVRGGKDPGKVHGAQGPARSRREFRRKSGG